MANGDVVPLRGAWETERGRGRGYGSGDDERGPWQTDSGEYDRSCFYTGSSDEKGQSASFKVTVPLALLSRMAQLVQQKDIPEYTTKEAIVRDALVHRLHDVAEMLRDGDLAAVVNTERLRAQAQQSIAEVESRVALVADVERALEKAQSKHDRQGLDDIVNSKPEYEKMKEPWRSDILRLIARHEERAEDW